MIRILCLIVLLSILPHPVIAGNGTIKETDTEIIIEYSGDENDKQAAKVFKEEQQKEAAKQEHAAEVLNSKIEKNKARNEKHRQDEE